MLRLLESRSRIRSQIEKLQDAFSTRGKKYSKHTWNPLAIVKMLKAKQYKS